MCWETIGFGDYVRKNSLHEHNEISTTSSFLGIRNVYFVNRVLVNDHVPVYSTFYTRESVFLQSI